ncbi:MAG TPA: FtsX-like permease family protein [Pantanalinema sp.]
MKFLKLAWRNLSRKRRQTFQNAFGLVIGLAVSFLMMGYMDGLLGGSLDHMVRTQSGHLKIQARGYQDEARAMPLALALTDEAAVTAVLRKHPEVSASAPRLRFACMIRSGARSFGVLGQGIDPAREETMGVLKRQDVMGRMPVGPAEVLLGQKLAEDLKTRLGRSVTVAASDADGQMKLRDYRVVGIFRTGLPSLDASVAYFGLADAQGLLAMPERVSEIGVLLHRKEQVAALAGALGAELPPKRGYEVLTWEDLNRELLEPIRRMQHLPKLVALVMLLSLVPSIMNTLIMSVSERFREIGAMRAMGMRPGEVIGLFLVEGLFLGLIGSTLGALIGGGLTYYLSIKGIPNPGFGMGGPVGNLPTLYPTFSPGLLALFVAAGVIGSVVAYYFPARMAAGLDPIKALRSN